MHFPKRIHWRKLITRKLLFMVGVLIACRVVEHFTHWHLASTGSELSTSALGEHLVFGVPFEEA